MIASTKLARAQRAMNSARAYGETSSGVLRSFFILALSDLLCYSNYFWHALLFKLFLTFAVIFIIMHVVLIR